MMYSAAPVQPERRCGAGAAGAAGAARASARRKVQPERPSGAGALPKPRRRMAVRREPSGATLGALLLNFLIFGGLLHSIAGGTRDNRDAVADPETELILYVACLFRSCECCSLHAVRQLVWYDWYGMTWYGMT